MKETGKILNLELHPNYFVYGVLDTMAQTFLSVDIQYNHSNSSNEIDLNLLSEWLKGHQKIWSTHYQKVSIAVFCCPTTLTPDTGGGITALKSLTPHDSDSIAYKQIRLNEDTVFTFGIPNEISHLLNSYFVNTVILPNALGILKNALEMNTGNSLYLHITPLEVSFFQLNHKKLCYYNTFRYNNQDDLLYYTLLVFKMLQLSTEEDKMNISGFIEQESEIYKLLYQYIRNIEISDYSIQIDKKINLTDTLHPNYLSNILYLSL
ncbi:MAG: DUF3822 family protein [Chitinophagales bacterium]|nr:DUF3822 family protein [Chitinophagales bacterium]